MQRDPYLDHGTFVSLYFLREAGVDGPYGFAPEGPEFDRQKGGISSREKYTLERFEVVRHT